MLATPRIRVGQRAGSFESTYTLGGTEAFRLDTASWAHNVAPDSDFCQPVLRCADADGNVFAEATPPSFQAKNTPNPFGFTYTGPAALIDDFSFQPPNSYVGYNFHDFGAVPITSNIVIAWDQPPGLEAAASATWFRSPGAVSIAASIGDATAIDASTVTARLTGLAPAGSYLMIAVSMLDTSRFVQHATSSAVSVTDNVGGNVLVFDGITSVGLGRISVRAASGLSSETIFLLYRITNPLPIGSRVTVTFTDTTIVWLGVAMHVVTGMAAVNPIGPNPGSSFLGIGGGSATSPITIAANPLEPTPVWVGGVMIAALDVTASDQTVDVMLERGGVAATKTGTSSTLPTHGYTQAALPELRLGPGDTLTAFAVNSSGDPRVGDFVSDFLIWGVDD